MLSNAMEGGGLSISRNNHYKDAGSTLFALRGDGWLSNLQKKVSRNT